MHEILSLPSIKKSINISIWPTCDENKIVEDTVKVGIQVNGKLRGAIEINPDKSEKDVLEEAKEIVKNYISGHDIKKTIYVKGKIISFVI